MCILFLHILCLSITPPPHLPLDAFGGPRDLLYTGLQLIFDDREHILKPNSDYDYIIEASNSRGYVSSLWATGTTNQAAPTHTPPPQVRVCLIDVVLLWKQLHIFI